jgi:hypothetical protein
MSRISKRQRDRRVGICNLGNLPEKDIFTKGLNPHFSFGKKSTCFKYNGGHILDIPDVDSKTLSLTDLNDALSFIGSPVDSLYKNGFKKSLTKIPSHKMIHFGIWMSNVKHYSGGRIHILLMANILAEMGHRVTIITDNLPTFMDDYKYFQVEDRLEFISGTQTNLTNWLLSCEVNNIDMVIATPRIDQAFSYAQKFNIPCCAMLFETPNWVSKFRGGQDGTDSYWADYKQGILTTADFVLCNPSPTLDYAKQWLDKDGYKGKIYPMPPAINVRAAEAVLDQDKVNEITFIGRHLDFKCPGDVVKSASVCDKDLVVNFIGSHNDVKRKTLRQLGKSLGVEVKFYSGINDYEKFTIIKRSKAVVIPTKFEGFGMPPAEAIFCKTPVVVYDLEITKAIYGKSVKYAPSGNWKEMGKIINNIIENPKESKKFADDSFKFMLDKNSSIPCHPYKIKNSLREIFYGKNWLKFTAGIIVLNGMDTIKHTIKSIYDDVEKIIIVEGVVEDYARANPSLHKDGHSIDETLEYIKDKSLDPCNKIEVVSKKNGLFKDKNEMQNEIAKRIKTELYIKVDADEVWKTSGLEYIRRLFDSTKDLTIAKIGYHHFWKGFKAVAVGGQWDSLVPRIWRWGPKFRHPSQKGGFNFFNDEKGNRVGKPLYREVGILEKLVYHLGYCRGNEHISGKISYYKSRGIEKRVNDNYSNWKEGMPTSSTHPNGTTAIEFKGKLPIILDEEFSKEITVCPSEILENNSRMLYSPLKG